MIPFHFTKTKTKTISFKLNKNKNDFIIYEQKTNTKMNTGTKKVSI